MSEELERAFADAVWQQHLEGIKRGHNSHWRAREIRIKGAVQAAKDAVRNPGYMPSGFIKHMKLGQQELTLEWLICQPEWCSLFTDLEVAGARYRLNEWNSDH